MIIKLLLALILLISITCVGFCILFFKIKHNIINSLKHETYKEATFGFSYENIVTFYVHTKLEHLDRSNLHIWDLFPYGKRFFLRDHDLGYLQNFDNFSMLNLDVGNETPLDEEKISAKALQHLFYLHDLNYLSLSAEPGVELDSLDYLLHMKNLEILDLVSIEKECLDLTSLTNLKRLDLRSSNVASLRCPKKLMMLYIGSQLPLHKIQGGKSLRFLDASCSKLSSKDLETLLTFKNLEYLNLSYSSLPLEKFDISQLTRLECLNLYNTEVNDSHITQFSMMKNLSELYLDCKITDAGSFLKLKSLSRLNVGIASKKVIFSLRELRKLEYLGVEYQGDFDTALIDGIREISNLKYLYLKLPVRKDSLLEALQSKIQKCIHYGKLFDYHVDRCGIVTLQW